MIISFKLLPHVALPVQDVFPEDEVEEQEFEVPKRTRNKKLERALLRAGRRSEKENYKEL